MKNGKVAEMAGAELETKGFRVEFANRIDGELYEIRRLDQSPAGGDAILSFRIPAKVV